MPQPDYGLSWEDKIIRVRVQLQRDQPFFWWIAMHLKVVEYDKCSTWATDGNHLFYNPQGLEKKWTGPLIYGVLHEIWHCAAEHMSQARIGDRKAIVFIPVSEGETSTEATSSFVKIKGMPYRPLSLWNIAIDMETNYLLDQAGFRRPDGVEGVPGEPGPAEAHYDRLIGRAMEMPGPDGTSEGGEGGTILVLPSSEVGTGPWDDHVVPDGPGSSSDSDSSDGPGANDSSSISKPPEEVTGKEDKESKEEKNKLGKEARGTEKAEGDAQDGSQGDGTSSSQARDQASSPTVSQDSPVDWKKVVQEATVLAESMKGQGTLPSSLEELIERAKHPRVDYRGFLMRFMSQLQRTRFTFEKPNRRFVFRGIYLPGPKKEISLLVMVVDSSGSMGSPELSQILAEMWSISTKFPRLETAILVVDADVQYICKHPSEVRMRGRGGTDFRPAFDYVKNEKLRPAGMIYFTDGYGTFPERPPLYPVVWAMTTDVKPPFGVTVRVPIGRTERRRK